MSSKGKSVAAPSVRKLRSVCIISDAELVSDLRLIMEARELGRELSIRKITVVHGGLPQGLAATVAQTAVHRRNEVLSITPPYYAASSSSSQSSYILGREMKTQNPYERMVFMLQHSDAFIIMPGGFVTLEMFASTVLWINAKVCRRPIGLLNINGYYDGLLAFLTSGADKGFISPEIRRLIVTASTPGQLINQLESLIQIMGSPPIEVIQYAGDKRKRDEPDTDLRL